MSATAQPQSRWPAFSPAGQLLNAIASRIAVGTLRVTLPGGERGIYGDAAEQPVGDLQVHRLRVVRRLLAGGGLGLAESYVDGDWDSDDLVALIELAARNEGALGRTMEGGRFMRTVNRALHLLRVNSRRGARRNIAAHYDIGNDFYRLWLDPSLTYSAAAFDDPGESLEPAQARKYAHMAALAGLRAGHEVLEIGCGWGGFCLWAAREIGCRVTAITISRQQYDVAMSRVSAAGLADRVDVRLQDYRDVAGAYDRVVSIEMLEAVGEKYWPSFFDVVRGRLKPGGRAALQVITIADHAFPEYRQRVDFIQRHIFPGGMLPSRSALRAAVERSGLTWEHDTDRGADYALTLAHWRTRFEQAWPEIAGLGFDDRFRRLWRFYLAYCEAGFRINRIGLARIALGRPED